MYHLNRNFQRYEQFCQNFYYCHYNINAVVFQVNFEKNISRLESDILI